MIEYKYPEEKAVALYYAELLNDSDAMKILLNGVVNSNAAAASLTRFYWSMVDLAVKDQGKGIAVLEAEGVEAWMEYIFHTFNGCLVSGGYEKEWDVE